MKKLSIIIPCHNEAENLPHLVSEIRAAMHRDDVEVVLVNDGSTDGSAEILASLTRDIPFIMVVTNATGQGYGGAVLAGLKAGQGEYLGWMHGDLQTPFKDALVALSKIEALGEPKNVYIKGLRKKRPLFDQFFTFGMSMFESVLLRSWLFDINAQPNVFHRSFFQRWENPPRDFSLDLFVLYLARVWKYTLIRMPVIFPPRQHGESHWNTGFHSKIKFIKRTIKFSFELKRRVRHDTLLTER